MSVRLTGRHGTTTARVSVIRLAHSLFIVYPERENLLPRIYQIDKDYRGIYLTSMDALRVRVNLDPDGNVESCYVHCDWMSTCVRVDLDLHVRATDVTFEYRKKKTETIITEAV